MNRNRRKAKSFTLEPGVVAYVDRTRGRISASERVNRMLKRAMEAERLAQLAHEASEFFTEESREERKERKAFQKAALRVLSKD